MSALDRIHWRHGGLLIDTDPGDRIVDLFLGPLTGLLALESEGQVVLIHGDVTNLKGRVQGAWVTDDTGNPPQDICAAFGPDGGDAWTPRVALRPGQSAGGTRYKAGVWMPDGSLNDARVAGVFSRLVGSNRLEGARGGIGLELRTRAGGLDQAQEVFYLDARRPGEMQLFGEWIQPGAPGPPGPQGPAGVPPSEWAEMQQRVTALEDTALTEPELLRKIRRNVRRILRRLLRAA